MCGFVSTRLDRYVIGADGTAQLSGPPIAPSCAVGVIRLSDGRLAYATESKIFTIRP
jgi:hypothetical protein